MLKNEVAFGIEEPAVQNLIGDGVETVERVWRIGKYDVELLAAERKEVEDIVADDREVVELELRSLRADE